MENKEVKFWQWFGIHQSEYLNLDARPPEEKERLLNVLLEQLHEYSQDLYFQIAGNEQQGSELVISAEGNKDYFEVVEMLVNSAPEIKGWQVTAFKQPMGADFITEYEGLVLNPKKISFLPLNNEQNPNMLGIRVCIEKYDGLDSRRYQLCMLEVLDTLLGEKDAATKIDYMEIDNLSKYQLEDDGLIELSKLPEYIKWKKGV